MSHVALTNHRRRAIKALHSVKPCATRNQPKSISGYLIALVIAFVLCLWIALDIPVAMAEFIKAIQ